MLGINGRLTLSGSLPPPLVEVGPVLLYWCQLPPLVPIEWIIRKQGKVAMAEHLRSKRGDDGERLDVQVSEHLIRFPAAQESNFVRVDGCAQQSHRARGAQGSDRDVTGGDAPGGANGGDGCA
jgi:hypothetical protein